MRRTQPLRVRLAVVLTVLLWVLALPASAAADPCWKLVVNDWYDGRIDRVYPSECYRAALDRLPEGAQSVSTVQSDLRRGLARSLAAPPTAAARRDDRSTVPALIVIAASGLFLVVATVRMRRARR